MKKVVSLAGFLIFIAMFPVRANCLVAKQVADSSSIELQGLSIKPDKSTESEVDVTVTTQDVIDAYERKVSIVDRNPIAWASVLLQYLAQPTQQGVVNSTGSLFVTGSQNEKTAVLLSKQINSLETQINMVQDNVNRPEIAVEQRKVLRLQQAALAAKAYNLILRYYNGNLEDAEFTAGNVGETGEYILYPTSPHQPFAVIKMSPYEIWCSNQVKKAQSDHSPEAQKHLRFLNRMLLDRFMTDQAPFATKVLGLGFTDKFNLNDGAHKN